MLKAAVIYLQGTGGNLLTRTLTLSEQTVAYLPQQYADQQPTMHVSSANRLQLYNNWNANNWPAVEKDLRIWYRFGLQDFVNYETTDKWLIDWFHPGMFEKEVEKKVLFENDQSWEHLIFIKFDPEDLPTIKKLSVRKRPDMEQQQQIQHNEIPCIARLIEQYPRALSIAWKDMFDLTTYVSAVKELANTMNLTLDYSQVEQLWTQWHQETEKILHE